MYSMSFTQDCFIRALDKLSACKEYSSISVSDLCKISGFSRSSFYRHFQSKEDLLLQTLTQVRNDCAHELQQSGYPNPSKEYYTSLFAFLRSNKSLLHFIHVAHLDFNLYLLLQSLLLSGNSISEDYQSDLLVGSYAMLIIRWIDKDMAESDADMAALLL